MVDGNNFGLNGSYEYNEYEFDSLDCDQGANSDSVVSDWPRFYIGKPIDKVAAIKVISATIPRTYYDLENSVVVNFLEYNGAGTKITDENITFPAGNYSQETFSTFLKTEMDTLGTLGPAFTVGANDITGKISITSSYATVNGSFILNLNGSTELALISGLDSGVNTSSLVTASLPASITAPNIGMFDDLTHLFLCSRYLGSSIGLYLPGNGYIQPERNGGDGPQLCKIPINADPFKNIHYQDPDPQKWFFMRNANLNGSIDFYFTKGIASSTTHLKFNGRGFSVKLGLLFSKEENTDVMKAIDSNKRVASRTWPTSGVMYS